MKTEDAEKEKHAVVFIRFYLLTHSAGTIMRLQCAIVLLRNGIICSFLHKQFPFVILRVKVLRLSVKIFDSHRNRKEVNIFIMKRTDLRWFGNKTIGSTSRSQYGKEGLTGDRDGVRPLDDITIAGIELTNGRSI